MMNKKYKVGDLVFFGRSNGQKTLGRITKVNTKKYKIEQLEARGTHPVGTKWSVPESLILGQVTSVPDGFDLPKTDTIQVTPGTFPTRSPKRFQEGQRVSFEGKRGETLTGFVIRVNTKTCSVRVDGEAAGKYWRVSPGLLTPVVGG